jgi:hypothetical protein
MREVMCWRIAPIDAMNDPTPELHIRMSPLRSCDHRQISGSKHNPLQRIKVSNATSLSTVANYLQRLAITNTPVLLHAPYRSGTVQVPLSMSVAELIFITNQRDTCELHYSFADSKLVSPPAIDLHQPPKLRHRQTYPHPTPKLPVLSIPFSDSIESINCGLSLFSNSFPPSIDEQWLLHAKAPPMTDVLSLRKNLELEIAKP